jgi:hypothetical protein
MCTRANPTIASYNATFSIVRFFQNKNYYSLTHCMWTALHSLQQRWCGCEFRSRRIGSSVLVTRRRPFQCWIANQKCLVKVTHNWMV